MLTADSSISDSSTAVSSLWKVYNDEKSGQSEKKPGTEKSASIFSTATSPSRSGTLTPSILYPTVAVAPTPATTGCPSRNDARRNDLFTLESYCSIMHNLSTLIKRHVETHYIRPTQDSWGKRSKPDGAHFAEFLGPHSPVGAEVIARGVAEPLPNGDLLRFAVGWMVMEKVKMMTREYHCSDESEAIKADFGRWRQQRVRHPVSYTLLQQHPQLLADIESLLAPFLPDFTTVFRAIARRRRQRSLQEILELAGKLAHSLSADPATWNFNWNAGFLGDFGFAVVWPALVMTMDEQKRILWDHWEVSPRELG
jgi:hypothetical protein